LGTIPESGVFPPLEVMMATRRSEPVEWISCISIPKEDNGVSKKMEPLEGSFDGPDAEQAWLDRYESQHNCEACTGIEDLEEPNKDWPFGKPKLTAYSMFRGNLLG
jgi:hypothetical protein